jgi:hypothetical protein
MPRPETHLPTEISTPPTTTCGTPAIHLSLIDNAAINLFRDSARCKCYTIFLITAHLRNTSSTVDASNEDLLGVMTSTTFTTTSMLIIHEK